MTLNKKTSSANCNNCYLGLFWDGKTFKRWGEK
jgi:hypothetical protein